MDYNPESGEFRWRVSPGRGVRIGDVAGTINGRGFVLIRIDGPQHYAHRLAFLYMTGAFPVLDIKHIDCAPSNNSWSNLREATAKGGEREAKKAEREAKKAEREAEREAKKAEVREAIVMTPEERAEMLKERKEYNREYAKRPEVKEERHARKRSAYAARKPVVHGRQERRSKRASDGDVYARALLAQGGHCKMCDRTPEQENPPVLCMDHDHDTGDFRGLLCRRCNTGLGKLGDDVFGVIHALACLVMATGPSTATQGDTASLVRMMVGLLSGTENETDAKPTSVKMAA